MHRRSVLLSAVASLVLAAAPAAAQRPISGRVTGPTDVAVVGATVGVVGTATIAATGNDGRFALQAPAGEVTLLVRAIGYKRRVLTVAPGQTTVDITLEEDVFNLEAIVVTGQATGVEQRNLPNAVTTVQAEQFTRAPTATVESALQGKVPGALIQANSGAPGGGMQISLRGVSTINAGVDPLIVVDGIVVSNEAIANGMNAVSAAAAGGNASNQDNAVNRIADLNPEDIERIEILKGASAAAIYGSRASNGVLLITTRRGAAGAPRFHLSQRFGQNRVSNLLGSRRFTDSADVNSVLGSGGSAFCPNNVCPYFDNERELWGNTDLSWETALSVTGGTENTTYYVSGLVRDEASIAPHTGYQKQSARVNLGQRLGARFQLNANLNVVHSLAQRAISNNDNTGTSPYLVFPFTYGFTDLRPTGPGVQGYPNNPFERSNPLQTFAYLVNDEDVWRGIGSASLTVDAIASGPHNLRLRFDGGADYFSQRNDILSPPELEFEPQDGQPGTVVLGKASNANLTLSGNAVYAYAPPSGSYVATTSLGVQWLSRDLQVTNITGRSLLTGQQNVDQATSISIAEDLQPVRDIGIYGQEEVLLLDQRLLATVGLRADRSSRNGDPSKVFFYPKAAMSYRFVQPASPVDELKLRGAWGQTGNQPAFGNKYSPDTTGTIGGRFGKYAGQRSGDPGITPERQTELEVGLDALLFRGRFNASFTWFNKTVNDLLLFQTLHPSSGQTDRVFNGGSLRNRGVEIGLGWSAIQRSGLNLILRGTFFSYRPVITELPVPAFDVGGFGTALGVFRIEEGKSATQIIGSEGKVGDATPDFQMGLSADLDWNQWSLGVLVDWKKGGDVINLTELLYDAGANSEDWNTAGQERWGDFLSGLTQPYVQDASYIKVREVTLSYRLPGAFTRGLFGSAVQSARLSLSGRNLLRFTDFRGIDPEVSNFGSAAIARNIDVAPYPPSRSLWFSIDLDF